MDFLENRKQVAVSVIEKILVNLRVLSTLTEGDKLFYTNTGNFVPQQPTLYNSLVRFVFRDDRWQTFSRLGDLISAAETMQEYNNGAEKLRIRSALEQSIVGLRNLQLTYQTDVLFFQSLEVLIERVQHVANVDQKRENTA